MIDQLVEVGISYGAEINVEKSNGNIKDKKDLKAVFDRLQWKKLFSKDFVEA